MKAKNSIGALKGVFVLASLMLVGNMQAQDIKKQQKEAKKYLYEAQEALSENNFASAEAAYRKAISKDPENVSAKYNMGNLYYNKEKAVSAESRLKEAAEVAPDKVEKHRIFHNLGNSYMKMKNYQAAVEAFKNALRNDPADEETRYNLALAKKMLEKEKNENQQDDKNKDKSGDDNKENDQQNKDKQNKDGEGGDDQNEKDKPKDEGENKEDKKEGDQNKDKDKEKGDQPNQDEQKGDEEQKQQQPQPAQGQLSPQQIKSLLDAMNNEEKKVQDKINAKKAKGVKVRSEKDW